MKKKKRCTARRGEDGKKTGKQDQTSTSHSRKLTIALAVTISIILILSINYFFWSTTSTPIQVEDQPNTMEMKAAILDGLYDVSSNATFTQTISTYLTNAGFQVELFNGRNVTVNLLRNIAGYKALILRLHSAIGPDGFLYLFTGEPYTQSQYTIEQLSGSVRKGVTDDGQEFFAINAAVLGKDRLDGLKDSTVIMMGCSGTADQLTIQTLFKLGVKTYVSWTGKVDLSQTDEATLRLVKALYVQKLDAEEAVAKVMLEVGPDHEYGSILECHINSG